MPSVKDVSPHGLIVGGMRYIFTKDIWPVLEKQGKGKGGEIWLADAADALARSKPFFAYEYARLTKQRFPIGENIIRGSKYSHAYKKLFPDFQE